MGSDVWVEALYAGCVYAVVALGFTMVFAPTRVLNFAQGESVVLGAAVGFQALSLWRWPVPAAVVAALALGVVMGVLQERMIMLPVRLSGSRFAWIIATLAATLVFQSLYTLQFKQAGLLRPRPLIRGALHLGSLAIDWEKVLVIVVAFAIMASYDAFLRLSAYGRALRAAAHDADTAMLLGIGVKRLVLGSFVLSAVVCTIAGLLVAPVLFIGPADGLLYTTKGFTAAVLGGLGSPRGALVGGLLVGVLDSVARQQFNTGVGNIVVYAALAAILIVFPRGLFGRTAIAH